MICLMLWVLNSQCLIWLDITLCRFICDILIELLWCLLPEYIFMPPGIINYLVSGYPYISICLYLKWILKKCQVYLENFMLDRQMKRQIDRQISGTDGQVNNIRGFCLLTAKVSSSTTYQINLSVCVWVCLHFWNSSFKCSPANQNRFWDYN